MVKKSKESSKKIEQKPDPNIFNQLFGETLEQKSETNSVNSLFSSENPFRRKIEVNPQIENPNPIPNKGTDEKSPENGKKLKVGKLGKNPNLGIGNEVELIEKKKKNKSNEKIPNLTSANPNLGNGSVIKLDEDNNKKKKNKRKRDELEKEYEARKYGIVKGKEDNEEKMEKVAVGKKRKAAESMAVLKEGEEEEEGFDDESKLLRTVFVGNLPLKVKKKSLIKEFSQFGEIDSVRIRSVPTIDSKKPKKVMIYNGKLNEAADSVHAYIVFKTEQAAEASLAHNMSVVEGNHIRVDRACPPRKKLKGESVSTPVYSSKRTIFVGNLPFDVKDEELYQLFCGIKEVESSIEAVRVIRDRNTSLGKGIAYVLFKTREAANLVCKKRKLKLRDRELRISHAKPETQSTPSKTEDSTPSKRKSEFPVDSESTPAKKPSSGKKTFRGRYNINPQGDTSYQGFRASKTGDKNKTPSRSSTPAPFKTGFKKGDKVKQRTEKRPSVEARKRKTLAFASKGSGFTKQAGSKRKMDARTPQSSNQKKKFRKSK